MVPSANKIMGVVFRLEWHRLKISTGIGQPSKENVLILNVFLKVNSERARFFVYGVMMGVGLSLGLCCFAAVPRPTLQAYYFEPDCAN